MAVTFTAISKSVLSSSASSITLSSIPGTYTDLALWCNSKSTHAASTLTINLTLNGSTSDFLSVIMDSYGSGQYSTTDTRWIYSTTGSNGSTQTNAFGSAELYFTGYAGSKYKIISSTYASEYNETGTSLGAIAGIWNNTSAITSITLTPSNGSFASGSRFDLYGIKNS